MNEFDIEGMTCQSCVAKIEDAFRNAGYSEVVVTLDPPRVKLPRAAAMTSEAAQKILTQAGRYKLRDTSSPVAETPDQSAKPERLAPLFIILAYITGGVLLRAIVAEDYSLASLMNNFMGGFFVIFSLFKLLNLSGFADAYATYDIIGSRSRTYALSYPFVELALGVAYFLGTAPIATNTITLVLMTVGSIGVFQALKTKRKFQCACLGTALSLPMTKVTLVEDVAMGLMALIMLAQHAAM